VIALSESPNTESRVLLELLETAIDLSSYGLATEADIARIEALREPQAGQMKTPREGRCE
jgi:hypothetical protein